ncbi:MAG: cytochrome d ubiquinol oxidase subunit II [Crocinitomicaceae bacterium]|nr:cytochrome d ubiquinol oxidase subunit II [Crocinitomicaceae bacterium]MDP4806096.1 cytochrome d ubiquinol oxidase subunit II [Crocinitomicaceae bacterium]
MEAATFLGLDYASWWFLVVGGLFSGYALLDGFDLGAGAWHLTFKKESSRRTALNAIGPVWDGNEVWLVIGGGALFAGFPKVYATLLSVMYTPFMLFLALIIFRAIAIEFRSKEPMLWWRKMWDIIYAASSILLAFLLGVVFGNVLEGLPIDAQHEFRGSSIFSFLRPFPILVGLTLLALFMTHGAIYLLLKTEGRLYTKIRLSLRGALLFFLASFTMSSFYALLYLPRLTQVFYLEPAWFIVPILAILSIANLPRLCSKRKYGWAFIFSSLTILLFFILAASNLYPTLLYSTIDPSHSLTVHNSSASEKSLGIMLLMALIGTPLVLTYTFFVYYTFRGKVRMDESSY